MWLKLELKDHIEGGGKFKIGNKTNRIHSDNISN